MNQIQENHHKIVQVARWSIAFVWVYHGFFPKLLTIAPMEAEMTLQFTQWVGIDAQWSSLITRSAGIGEIVFGVLLFCFYRSKVLIAANVFGLVALLLMAAVCTPAYLIEAFNPVTVNLSVIALSAILWVGVAESHATT